MRLRHQTMKTYIFHIIDCGYDHKSLIITSLDSLTLCKTKSESFDRIIHLVQLQNFIKILKWFGWCQSGEGVGGYNEYGFFLKITHLTISHARIACFNGTVVWNCCRHHSYDTIGICTKYQHDLPTYMDAIQFNARIKQTAHYSDVTWRFKSSATELLFQEFLQLISKKTLKLQFTL